MSAMSNIVQKMIFAELKAKADALNTLRLVFGSPQASTSSPPGAHPQVGLGAPAGTAHAATPFSLAEIFTTAAQQGSPHDALVAQHMLQRIAEVQANQPKKQPQHD